MVHGVSDLALAVAGLKGRCGRRGREAAAGQPPRYNPGQVLSEDLGRSGGDRAARLVELGAKRPDSAAELCQAILVLEDALDAGAKPILGRSSFAPSLPLRGQLRQPQFDDRL